MSKDMEQDKNQFAEENTDAIKEFIPGAMGDRISYLRKKGKLTQAQLAERLGISAQAVSKWESGLSCPDIMTLVPLAQILGVSTDELLGLGSGSFTGSVGFTRVMEDDIQDIQIQDGQGIYDSHVNDNCAEAFTEVYEKSSEAVESGVSSENGKGGDFSEVRCQESRRQETIHSLFISAGACAVTVETGDRFRLRTEGYQGTEIVSEVSDGVWRISDSIDKSRIFGIKSAFRIRKIMVTIPKDHHFEMVKLNIGAGAMEVNGIHTSKSILNAGAGQLIVKDFDVIDTSIKCGMGEIDFKGSIWGRCDVDCGMGCVKAVLRKTEDYGYSASVGMGDVRIGDYVFSGVSGKQMVNKGADNFYKVSCSMGTVKISFE